MAYSRFKVLRDASCSCCRFVGLLAAHSPHHRDLAFLANHLKGFHGPKTEQKQPVSNIFMGLTALLMEEGRGQWPPDPNPIEDLWDVVEQDFHIMDVQLTKAQQLHDAFMTICTKISEEHLQHLVESMSWRIETGQKTKQGPALSKQCVPKKTEGSVYISVIIWPKEKCDIILRPTIQLRLYYRKKKTLLASSNVKSCLFCYMGGYFHDCLWTRCRTSWSLSWLPVNTTLMIRLLFMWRQPEYLW